MTFWLRRIGVLTLAVSVFLTISPYAAEAHSVTLEWNPNPDSDLQGYRLYIGRSSRSYDNVIPVGLTTMCRLVDLPPNNHYYLALSAVNQAGLESEHSDEILYLPPVEGGRLSLFQSTSSSFEVTLSGIPGTSYAIQSSNNLRDASGMILISGYRSHQLGGQFFRAVRLP